MEIVLLTAAGIGGATVIGALLGFVFVKIPHKWNDAIMGFAAGVMLAASIMGLILPAVELTGKGKIWIVGMGIFAGAFLNASSRNAGHITVFYERCGVTFLRWRIPAQR